MTKKNAQKSRSGIRRQPGGQATRPQSPDTGIVFSVLLLVSMGTVMSYSTTATLALDRSLPPLFLAHLGALGIGLVVATIIMWIPIDRWRQAALPLWLISLGMLILVEFFGCRSLHPACLFYDLDHLPTFIMER